MKFNVKHITTFLKYSFIILIFTFQSCQEEQELHSVSVAEFSEFVEATNYVTDAEKFDWSIVQINVFDFIVLYGIDWRCPTGFEEAHPDFPVMQVSYNDAIAYCKWANVRLPSYDEYWELTKNDMRPIVESAPEILPMSQANLIGNVWEITTTERLDGEIRLAGGSYMCNKNTCNGTNAERRLFVDKMTGNSHISFAVVR